MSNVNLYTYTAAANPFFVKSLAHKYGYVFEKTQPLGTVLQQLVAYEGEPVLMEIIENSPDKDLFVEYYEKKFGKKDPKCTCGEDKPKFLDGYMNFSGNSLIAAQQSENKKITTETSLMVLAGAVLIAIAIITKN